MPTQSPTVRVILKTGKGERRRFDLTATQVRALETASEAGKVSDAIPFHSARSMTAKGLLRQDGPAWFVTALGRLVQSKLFARDVSG